MVETDNTTDPVVVVADEFVVDGFVELGVDDEFVEFEVNDDPVELVVDEFVGPVVDEFAEAVVDSVGEDVVDDDVVAIEIVTGAASHISFLSPHKARKTASPDPVAVHV